MTFRKEPSLKRRRFSTPGRIGFSLIELLVVIGLIAVLSSLLLIGIGKLQTSSRRQATHLAFQNLQALYSEWDVANRHHFINYQDVNTGVNYSDVAAPCPGNVAVGGTDRNGNAVLATRDQLALMRQLPTNATAMGKFSASAIMAFPAPVITTSAYSAGTPYEVFFGTCSVNSTTPFAQPIVFRAVAINWTTTVSQTVQPSPANDTSGQFWRPVCTDPTVPVLLDGWGNPIIFVPGGILGYDGKQTQNGGGTSANKGLLTAGGNTPVQVKSPDGRPFWASAGPDGDFSLGDDNLYSFEK